MTRMGKGHDGYGRSGLVKGRAVERSKPISLLLDDVALKAPRATHQYVRWYDLLCLRVDEAAADDRN